MADPPHFDDAAGTTKESLDKFKTYANSLPYSVEPNSEMQELLDFFLNRIVQCVEAKDYDPGLIQWDSMLAYWFMLKYPLPKTKRVKLARLYFDLCVTPGMPLHIVSTCSDTLAVLIRSKKKITVDDLRLPWKPIYDILEKDLFLSRREFEITQTSYYMGYIAEFARRFFHPSSADEMLDMMLPKINGMDLSTILATQYYLNTFLPLSHPTWLPALMRLWKSINSYMFDERHLALMAQLAEKHTNPTLSDPARLDDIPDDATPGEKSIRWDESPSKGSSRTPWKGIYKDVGIFSRDEWDFIMCKCLGSMEIPLADSGSLTTGPTADAQASFEFSRLPKPTWRIYSLARLIVWSMAPDSKPSVRSGAATPFASTPFEIPLPVNGLSSGGYFDVPMATDQTCLAGCKALDSLARLVVSIESFFHPSNSGSWTADLTAFIKYVASEFNKRWHEERKPDCKTPLNRRLTPQIRRELVRCLRTVALLAMFSTDSQTVSNVQSALKSMTVMEPDLILPSILERAIPSLEALVETRRTTAVIKALGSVALALTSRDIYYPGAKHLLPILELLLPGIDLNDPTKTLCTTAFLSEISQHVKFGDLTIIEPAAITEDNAQASWSPIVTKNRNLPFDDDKPTITFDLESDPGDLEEPRLSNDEEDSLLRESTSGFAQWVASFIRRVILLLENLPEERASGPQGGSGETETTLVDSVTAACSQICVHLSEPLFDLVLNLIYDFASTTVRSNAVRAVHQLVECVANANPEKTLARFVPFCIRNIRTELEHGASALRTTSMSRSLPSDATLHWNLAILRGTMCNDGRAVLKYKDELMSLLKLLHQKTFSKRGFSWTGKLLCSIILTLTHTYPLENKFANPDEWNSEAFRSNHHQHWGKLYDAEEVVITWHTPNRDEIDFALEIFTELITPALQTLEDLLDPSISRDADWRNDFCRHLSLVRNAFAGSPTLRQEFMTPEEILESCKTSDVLHELPEFIASVQPLKSGFALDDPSDPRYQAITSIRTRFGNFLHKASASLLTQGDENTVDAVLILIRSCRTYLFEYGDSRDGYYTQRDQFAEELGFSRRYVGQKKWPRSLFVRRARLYHSARLRWNTLERRRSALEDSIMDDMVQWSLWHYATVRAAAQSLLESMTSVYDGIRRRCLPQLYKALAVGTEDDRMKGALYTLNTPVFAKFAMGDPTLTTDFLEYMFGCQWNEKPSIQTCAAMLAENCLNTFAEPSFLVDSIEHPSVAVSATELQRILPQHLVDPELVDRGRVNRVKRHELQKSAISRTTRLVTDIANRTTTHWKYSIGAIRILRTLVRRDEAIYPPQLKYFLDKTCAEHPTIRYYAQRAIMKTLRYIKLRTTSGSIQDLSLSRNHNPLRHTIQVTNPTHEFTSSYLEQFKAPIDRDKAQRVPTLQDKVGSGWLVWSDMDLYLLPDDTKSPFQPWEPLSAEAVNVVRKVVTDPKYWEKLSTHYAEENHQETTSSDNISCVKSIFQLLQDECFEAARPTIEKLLANTDQNKQRAAAELLAGLLGGSKHWPMQAQDKLWKWFTPLISTALGTAVKTDTLNIWSSFLEYIFANKDPRRLQPLVDWLVQAGLNMDFNASASFQATKTSIFVRTMMEELSWRFAPWSEVFMQRYWSELASEHDEVRACIADALGLFSKIHWRPKVSLPIAKVFIHESRTRPASDDIMGVEHGYGMSEFKSLVEKLPSMRESRLPAARAPRSPYDRSMMTIIKWLFQGLHDVNATSMFQYILPILPEVFKAAELQDSDELAARAQLLLVGMCAVSPPARLVPQLLNAIFQTIQTSPSWRIRLNTMPVLQIFYFRQVPLIDEDLVIKIQEVLCDCLNDEVVEVREKAATTLSGILRCSPRRTVLILKERFIRQASKITLPNRNSPNYATRLRQLHAAVLGATALIEAFPYSVPTWLPDLIQHVLARHMYDPLPISSTVRKCASKFKETHSDTWHEDSLLFNEDQMSSLTGLLAGASYYA